MSVKLKKEKEALDWKVAGRYDIVDEFDKSKYDLKQFIRSNIAEREKTPIEI